MSASAVEQAIASLVEQLGVDPSAIEVARTVEMTWHDGSIGCAQPGFMYTQALVSGQLIELVSAGQVYAFHQGGENPPFYCPAPTQAPPS